MGEDLPIRLFRLEDITPYYTEEQLGASCTKMQVPCITELVERTPGIIAFVPQKFIVRPDSVHLLKDNTISVKDVFAGAEWFPTATPAAQFGFLPLITGTLVGQSVCHPLCIAVWSVGGNLYVGGSQFPVNRIWLKPSLSC